MHFFGFKIIILPSVEAPPQKRRKKNLKRKPPKLDELGALLPSDDDLDLLALLDEDESPSIFTKQKERAKTVLTPLCPLKKNQGPSWGLGDSESEE